MGHGGGGGGRGGLGRDEGRLSGPVARVLAEIGRDPVALKMSYPPRAAAKAALLAGLLGPPREGAAHFYEAVLLNAGLKDTHLAGSLKFLKDRPAVDRARAADLLGLLWDAPDEAARRWGLSEDKAARDALTADTLARLDRLRAFLKAAPPEARDAGRLRAFARALELSGAEALELAALKPRLLRGLWKHPRPRWAWPLPVLAAALLGAFLAGRAAPLWALYAAVLGAALVGTSVVSLFLPVAPGVLRYEPVRRRLRQAFAARWEPSPAVARLKALGVDWEAFARAGRLEDAAAGVRVEARDKRSLEGAAQFLASSEDIGNCIALRHFVSWTLPALLDDESVMLADVSVRTSKGFQPRGQVWLVAAERGGVPVLCVNSFEFNEAGARDMETTLPVCVAALKDVCARAGFKALVLGITDFGRSWLDARYAQLPPGEPVVKVHASELGRRYHFDSFVLRRGRWEFAPRRSAAARLYALLFGAVELARGNPAKAAAFLDSARDARNAWSVPLDS